MIETSTPRECYNLIAQAAEKQKARLFSREPGIKREKAQSISAALDRLFAAVTAKYPEGVEVKERCRIYKIDISQLDELDLTTVDKMLDVKIRVWEDEVAPWVEGGMEFSGNSAGYRTEMSLRSALNISLYNVLNYIGATWSPIWGKSEALKEVEKELEI